MKSPSSTDAEGQVEPKSTSVSALEDDAEEKKVLMSGKKLALVFCSFMVAFSLVALDQTIISTALPTIASHFEAVSDLSWIASAYFLPQASFMLFFGRVLTIAPAKPVFMVSVIIFEIGSLFCAVAPSINFLIFGRAVAGLGGSGLWVSIMVVIARVTTMSQRPLLMGLFGAVYAVSSIVGPLLGGVFADHVSWRWCFYINLPLGPISLVAIYFFLPNNPPVKKPVSQRQAWLRLDWIGAILSFAAITLLLIALQWGGNTKPWSDVAVIVSLVLGGLFVLVFLYWEYRQGAEAILPVDMLMRRSIFGACVEAFFVQMGFVLAIYYLPLFYQLRGHSATRSGIDILPFMISGVLATVIVGGIITTKGFVWPFLFLFPLLASASFGLLFTVVQDTSSARLAGFQILLGVGLGAAIQNTVVAAQAEYVDNEALVPQATSLVTFMQLIGSAVGLAATGAVFTGQLKAQIAAFAPSLPPTVADLVRSSIKAIFSLPEAEREAVSEAYIAAVDRVFLIGIPAAFLASASALLIRRERIKKPPANVAS